jgi:hypothetical protein
VGNPLIEIIAERVEQAGGHELAPKLYRMVSERIRARLDPDEAAVVAAWFDRLAAGEDPRKVFATNSRGRKKKGKDGPDDYDIAWIVHLAIEHGVEPTNVYREVAKRITVTGKHGERKPMDHRTVANIYSRLKAEITRLHKNSP